MRNYRKKEGEREKTVIPAEKEAGVTRIGEVKGWFVSEWSDGRVCAIGVLHQIGCYVFDINSPNKKRKENERSKIEYNKVTMRILASSLSTHIWNVSANTY